MFKAKTLLASFILVSSSTVNAEISSTVTFASEYLWRGVTQTEGDPAIQGSIDYSNENGFYAGIWGSNVNYGAAVDSDIEVDLYAGYAGNITEDLTFDVGAIRYTFPSSTADDFNEVYGALGYGNFSLAVNYSDDFAGLDEDSFYYNASYSRAISEELSISISAGYHDLDISNSNATDYLIGASYSFEEVNLNVAYFDYDNDTDSLDDDGVVVSVSRSF